MAEVEKHYPRSERGQEDDGADRDARPDKPCAKRIDHENLCRFETSVTWCTEPEGHDGQCSGPLPSIVTPSSRTAMRLRGLQHDLFADKFEQRNDRSKR